CPPLHKGYSKTWLANRIWNNKSDAYSKLRNQVEAYVKEDEANRILKIGIVEINREPEPEPKGPIGWWWK
ncbi:MAG: hypothetical protein ACJ749_18900, partial [Flavisolibacter sp.]